MNKVLEGMARASVDADGCDGDYDKNPHEIREALATDMKRALLWLADFFAEEVTAAEFETSDKIKALKSAIEACDKAIVFNRYEQTACAIAAALRAAAGSALEAKP